jgi:hypothetical protein
VLGSLKVTNTDVVGDSSYPTNGTALTPAQLGLSVVVFAITSVKVVGGNGPAEAYYDIPNSKLKCFTATGEVSNTTSLSGATIQITAFGY